MIKKKIRQRNRIQFHEMGGGALILSVYREVITTRLRKNESIKRLGARYILLLTQYKQMSADEAADNLSGIVNKVISGLI